MRHVASFRRVRLACRVCDDGSGSPKEVSGPNRCLPKRSRTSRRVARWRLPLSSRKLEDARASARRCFISVSETRRDVASSRVALRLEVTKGGFCVFASETVGRPMSSRREECGRASDRVGSEVSCSNIGSGESVRRGGEYHSGAGGTSLAWPGSLVDSDGAEQSSWLMNDSMLERRSTARQIHRQAEYE